MSHKVVLEGVLSKARLAQLFRTHHVAPVTCPQQGFISGLRRSHCLRPAGRPEALDTNPRTLNLEPPTGSHDVRLGHIS